MDAASSQRLRAWCKRVIAEMPSYTNFLATLVMNSVQPGTVHFAFGPNIEDVKRLFSDFPFKIGDALYDTVGDCFYLVIGAGEEFPELTPPLDDLPVEWNTTALCPQSLDGFPDIATFQEQLLLDGTWLLDGTYTLCGLKIKNAEIPVMDGTYIMDGTIHC